MITLPERWTVTELVDGRVVLNRPEEGYVTIDYARRGFDLGYGSRSPPKFLSPYAKSSPASGWQALLEADAVAALNKIYEGKK